MTVRELIAILSNMDPDRTIILQEDAEGNGYSPLAGCDDNALYFPDSTWSGEVYPEYITEEMRKAGFTEEGDIHEPEEDTVRAVILYPIN